MERAENLIMCGSHATKHERRTTRERMSTMTMSTPTTTPNADGERKSGMNCCAYTAAASWHRSRLCSVYRVDCVFVRARAYMCVVSMHMPYHIILRWQVGVLLIHNTATRVFRVHFMQTSQKTMRSKCPPTHARIAT